MFLLGVLRSQELHGYTLVEYLNKHLTGGAAIGKSNAYRLLASMASEGLIRSHRERQGRRPERFVYEVTPRGEKQFQSWLAEALADDPGAAQPGVAELNYLDALPPAVAAAQLMQRRDQVAQRLSGAEDLPEQVRSLHPAMDLSQRLAEVELAWLDDKIKKLVAKEVAAA